MTDDRLGEGTVGAFPVATNFLLKQIGEAPFWRDGFEQRAEIDTPRRRSWCANSTCARRHRRRRSARLSGGNIQKVLLARELADGAKVVIFNKPTYGLDLPTRSRRASASATPPRAASPSC